ncbi:accessory Sec system glycosylation chaperone GtfB [Lactobacillus crispatus]|uniref:UDP-N-acetylglucosamine--peptide N-acetylglucosaminyltransferase stabilizing protein GtfB n=1 Tax=Lactobacillus crispatus TaxID=47770 RepID=A0A7H9E6L8_9LACO|nr:accessory Sec system glycosylation chaperone GtfB [Lactobacillus crispatus]QLL73249.1 accessory Sec system glycosylation chaperone GtfB [Lactobacillus crispatus]
MLNLFENFDTDTVDLIRSQNYADLKIPTVVVHDDGFLPDDIDSPIKYYCDFSSKGKPLYFDKLPLPKFWRITADANKGEVFDLDKKRAEIHFVNTDNSRQIKEVQWLDNEGEISWVNHYNSKGDLFAQTYYNNKQAVLRKYYDRGGNEVMTYHLVSGDIFLNYQGKKKHFAGLVDFVVDYLQERKYQLDNIFYNSLNVPFFVSLKLPDNGIDTLFWHEVTGDQLPGNMQYLMKNDTRTKHIIFQKYDEWQKWKSILRSNDDNVKFDYLGMIYPHPRSNKLRANALIMTNSDNIEKLTELVTAMPEIHFNIAAVTLMSDKLMAFDKYKNVELYPSVTQRKVNELITSCDIYLDINHGSEILDSVRAAFEQNMLIIGFKDTLHNQQYISDDNVFKNSDIVGVRDRVVSALSNIKGMKELVDAQRQQAGDMSIESYKKTFGVLKNERIKEQSR